MEAEATMPPGLEAQGSEKQGTVSAPSAGITPAPVPSGSADIARAPKGEPAQTAPAQRSLSGFANILPEAVRACRSALFGAAIASGLVNILALTSSVFMLQVYDRVLPSRSVSTLVGLGLLAGFLLGWQALLDALRSRLLA